MSDTYTIIAIVGFSLAALLAAVAVVMFFTLHIKEVRNDLTGKTATRSIAEIRARAKTRKRTTTQAAKRYGWEKEEISTDALKAVMNTRSNSRRATSTGSVKKDARKDDWGMEDEAPTTFMDEADEGATTILNAADKKHDNEEDELSTTILGEAKESLPNDEETSTTVLKQKPPKKKKSTAPANTLSIILAVSLAFGLTGQTSFAWGNDEQEAPQSTAYEEENQPETELADEMSAVGVPEVSETQEETQLPDKRMITVTQEKIVVPYGVDIEEWINQQDFYSRPLDEVKSYFSGQAPLKVVLPENEYPKPDSTLSLAWNESAFTGDAQQVGLGSFAGVKATTGKRYTWLPDEVSAVEGEVEYTDYFLARISDNLYLSFEEPLTAGLFKADFDKETLVWTEDNPLDLKTDGALYEPKHEIELPSNEADYPFNNVYVKIDKEQALSFEDSLLMDPLTQEAITLVPGQIVKLPCACIGEEGLAAAEADGTQALTRSETEPSITNIEWEWTKGKRVGQKYYAYSATLKLTVIDPRVDPENPTANGIKSVSLKNDDSLPVVATEDPENADVFLFSFTDKGSFPLEKMNIKIEDNEGTSFTESLWDAYGTNKPQFKTVVITKTTSEAGFTYNTEDIKNGYYLGTDAQGTVTIKDSDFEDDDWSEPVLQVTREYEGVTTKSSLLEKAEFTYDASISAYTAPFTLSEQGEYSLELVYKNFSQLPGQETTASFCIDTGKPEFGSATVNPTGPVSWGWIFAPGEATIDIELDDSLSGIDESTISVAPENPAVSWVYDSVQKILRLTISADDGRIDFLNLSIYACDRAGNSDPILSLKAYENTNIDEKVVGIITDSADPILEVSYDNNDAHNGSYYNVKRTATVTLTEASFDIVQENDPRRVIATKTINGSTQSIYAQDFSRLSGDTWVASIPCDADGDYRIAAWFTDPAGKSAQSYQETFIVDTMKPGIMVTFDNNSSESGWYFKSPRTATITIFEENFSSDMTSVVATATDAAGNAVGAPGISGWEQFEPGKWRTTIGFSQELHYSLQVGCTDLAGNAAEEVTEPEFVIDMTAPIVRIEYVENYVAYADKIAPQVSFEDTNFEPYLCNITITGASQEQASYMKNSETITETSRVVNYEDFDYKVEVDDVYTLHAQIKDKAGNESEQTVVFSVNRFGSNYVLSQATKPLMGSYLQKPHEVVITETNVSGLESSSVRLAHNDSVSVLTPGEDYALENNESQAAWSSYTYTLPAELFAEDGYYRTMLASHDIAGNYSENLMEGKNDSRDGALMVNFAIDGTSPVAALSNIEQETAYFGPGQRVDIFTTDNMEAESAYLKVDGTQVAQWDSEELAQTRAFTYDLPASKTPHEVKIEVKDKAGNTAVVDVAEVTVTSNWFRYIANTPAILYPLIAGTILLLGAVLLISGRLIHLRRKENKMA